MPTAATMLLTAVPALLLGVQPSQAVTLSASAAPLRRTGNGPDMMDSPMKQIDELSDELQPLMKHMKGFDLTAGQWPQNAMKLAETLRKFDSIWECYGTSQGALPSAVKAAERLALTKGPDDDGAAADIKLVFDGFQSIVQEFHATREIIEDQSYLQDLRESFRGMGKQVKGVGWEAGVSSTAAEIAVVYDKYEVLKKERTESIFGGSSDVSPRLTLAEIGKYCAQTRPAAPEGAKPAPAGLFPLEPAKPVEPPHAKAGWIGDDQKTLDEKFKREEAQYEEKLLPYEGTEMEYYEEVSAWANMKEEEAKWAVYDLELRRFQQRAMRVQGLIHGFLADLKPKITVC